MSCDETRWEIFLETEKWPGPSSRRRFLSNALTTWCEDGRGQGSDFKIDYISIMIYAYL